MNYSFPNLRAPQIPVGSPPDNHPPSSTTNPGAAPGPIDPTTAYATGGASAHTNPPPLGADNRNPYQSSAQVDTSLEKQRYQRRHLDSATQNRADKEREMGKIREFILGLKDPALINRAYNCKLLHFLPDGGRDVSYNVGPRVQNGLTLKDVHSLLGLSAPEESDSDSILGTNDFSKLSIDAPQTNTNESLKNVLWEPLRDNWVKIQDSNIEKAIESGFLQRKNGTLELNPEIVQQIQDWDFDPLIDLYKLLLGLKNNDPQVLWAERVADQASGPQLQLARESGRPTTEETDSQIEGYSKYLIKILLGKEKAPLFIGQNVV